MLLISVSAVMRGLATGFYDLFAAVALFGLGGPAVSVGLPKLVAEWFAGPKRALASGGYVTGSTARSALVLAATGSLVMPLVGSWRTTLQLYGLLAFAVGIIWLALGREPQDRTVRDGLSGLNPGRVTRLVRERGIWPVITVGFGSFLSGPGFRNWPPQVLECKGASVAEAGLVASAVAVAGMVGSILITRWDTVPGRRRKTAVGLLVTVGPTITGIALLNGPAVVAAAVIQGF